MLNFSKDLLCVGKYFRNLKEKNIIKIKFKDNNFVKLKIIFWSKINCY